MQRGNIFINTNISEQVLLDNNPELLKILLFDRTTNGNIIWGTDDYQYLGEAYFATAPITVQCITGCNAEIIQPRSDKTDEQKGVRTKDKAEVFTPAWICNAQNNLVDNAWFGRPNVFNQEFEKGWETNAEKIIFPNDKKKTWQSYVDERRLEIACGEAPYLTSRYDATTGNFIAVADRIGLLDRKLRIVTENTESEAEWLKWAERAVQSIYGFEFQGDSLLLARENILATYLDFRSVAVKKPVTQKEMLRIAKIISWNLWQMDGLTQTVPHKKPQEQFKQVTFLDLFTPNDNERDDEVGNVATYCKIKDWRAKKIIEFRSLLEEKR